MKKLLLFLTTFCMVCSAGNVFASPIAAGLETQLNKQLPTPLSSRQQQIVGALTQATSAKPRKVSWKMFEQEAAQSRTQWQNQREQFQALKKAVRQQNFALYKQVLNPITEIEWQQIEYAPELLNATHIFIGERHDTTGIPAQVENILASVRQINPHARILLAMESIRPEADQVPILFSDGDASRFRQSYANVVSKAQSLDMDLLALDIWDDYSGQPVCRIGDNQVTYDLKSSLVQRIIQQYSPQWEQKTAPLEKERKQLAQQTDQVQEILLRLEKNPAELARKAQKVGMTSKQYLEIHQEKVKQAHQRIAELDKQINDFRQKYIYYYVTYQLAASAWGVNQRNALWARYIQAVQPFYDIIIVYAGGAHLNSTIGFQPLTKHLQIHAQKAVLFTFQTNERLPAEVEQVYKQAGEIQRQENLVIGQKSSLPKDAAQAVAERTNSLLDGNSSFYIKRSFHPWKSPWITPQEETLLGTFQTQYPQGFAALKPSDDIPEFITLDIFLPKDALAATSTQPSPI